MFFEAPGSDLLSHGLSHTTIGAGAFHFRVRDGIGWDHAAVSAREAVKPSRSGAPWACIGLGRNKVCSLIDEDVPSRYLVRCSCEKCGLRTAFSCLGCT